MKFSVNRESFLRAFAAAESLCPNKADRPVLQAVRATVDQAGCTLQSSDLECFLTSSVACTSIDKQGSCLLPAMTTSSIFRESRCEQIVIESSKDGHVRIVGESCDFSLQTEPVNDFPVVKQFECRDGKYSTLPAPWLREAIKRTIFASDPNNTKYTLGGVCIEFTPKGKCYLVATDGNRIACMAAPATAFNEHFTPERSSLIPQKAARRIVQILDEEEGSVDVSVMDSLNIRCGTMEFNATLLQGVFPPWRRAFVGDIERETSVSIPAGVLTSLMRQAMIVTSKETRGLVFEFTPSMLKVSSSATERGKSGVQVPIVLQGNPVTLEMRGNYVLDFASLLKPEVIVTMELKDAETSVMFSTEDDQHYAVSTIITSDTDDAAKEAPKPAKEKAVA